MKSTNARSGAGMRDRLLIPGTTSVAHLRENMKAAALVLPPRAVAALDAIGQESGNGH